VTQYEPRRWQYTQRKNMNDTVTQETRRSTVFSKCLLSHDVVRVFVSSLVLVFVLAILSWCP